MAERDAYIGDVRLAMETEGDRTFLVVKSEAAAGESTGLTDAQLRASPVPVRSSVPAATSAVILAVQTSVNGTDWTAFGNQACVALDIVNNTGTTIEYRRGAAGTAMQIPADSARMVIAITNANQIEVRRTDVGTTRVTLQAEAFTA